MPSRINCMDSAHNKIPIILENTCKNLVFINFSYFIVIKNITNVINKTRNNEIISYNIVVK